MTSLAAAKIALWREKPQVMVRDLFGVTPDPWQDKALAAFPTTPRMAMKASKGPGKTALLAWCAWNFLLTRTHPNIAATSISADNLRDNLWKEMAHWRNKAPLLQEMFEWQTERIFSREFPATWFMSARSWPRAADPEQIGNTLAGLHADNIMFVIDESGSIPVAITVSAEAAFSSAKECHILQAGNTNSLEGALYDACVTRKHLWRVIPITGDPDDPDRSTRVSIDWAKDMIATYGRDSQFVKVMVLGEWPSASLNALLGADEVEAAMKRWYAQDAIEGRPKILGVDVAREGDDASVIFPRQGLVAFKPKVMRNVTGITGAGQVARMWEDWGVNACFVDNTGGFGASWIDCLTLLNRTAIPVGFAEQARDPKRYFNRRTEMYFDAAQWIKNGGALPDVPEMVAELTQTTYTFKGDRLIIEPKEIIKAKIGRSPDHTDGFVLTFAEPVAAVNIAPTAPQRQQPEYDPFRAYLRAG